MLTACGSSTTLYAVPEIKSTVPVMPANLAMPCPDLPLIEGEGGKAVMQWALLTVKLYRECQAKVRGLQGAWPK